MLVLEKFFISIYLQNSVLPVTFGPSLVDPRMVCFYYNNVQLRSCELPFSAFERAEPIHLHVGTADSLVNMTGFGEMSVGCITFSPAANRIQGAKIFDWTSQ